MKTLTLLGVTLLYIFFDTRDVFCQNCSCKELLDTLITRVETDYAGYIHKVKETGKGSVYNSFKKNLQSKAGPASFADCYSILVSYTNFFHDGHLFVAEFPSFTPAQSDSLYNFIKHADIPSNYTEALMKEKNRDPIEGIWKDIANQQIAVVKIKEDLFYGVMQEPKTPKWEKGMVKFELQKIKPNEYNITYYRGDFAKIRFTGLHIYKNVFFPFGVYRLAKIFPYNPEIEYINTSNPSLPVMKALDKNNLLLTVPSALIDGNYLDSLLDKYDSILKITPNLIIDLRGNTGGNYIWGRLLYIANTIEHPVQKNGDDFLMLASHDDAEYVSNRIQAYHKSIKDTPGIAYYDQLINRINDNPGKIIGFSYYSARPDTAQRVVMPMPKEISVIIDSAVASAAEAFILSGEERSKKMILYGCHTYGMIDYMNVNVLLLNCGENKTYYFGYPTFFSKEIKTHPINPTGIKPDVAIPLSDKDWIKWVMDAYNKKAG